MPLKPVSIDTLNALQRFARDWGNAYWKKRLRLAWDTGQYPSFTTSEDVTLLQSYRNAKNGGLSGLDRIVLEAALKMAQLPGCIDVTRSKRTGTMVGLYNVKAAGALLADVKDPYAVVCEVHGVIEGHRTRASARDAMPDPTTWCHGCSTTSR